MSIKSLIQTIILLTIIIILGAVYYKYFSTKNNITEEITEEVTEKITEEVTEKITEEVTEETTEEVTKIINENNKLSSNKKDTSNLKIIDQNNLTEKKISDVSKNNQIETKKVEKIQKQEINNENENKAEKTKEKSNKNKKITNLVKDVEYLTTDKNGNEYKIIATSGKTNLENNSILDLNNVRGIVTSRNRAPIYIVSDFAEYNSSTQNSKFYQNVVINYADKEITCDNFDINMDTNIAVAYNNVKVTDPKSVMYAGEITLDIETKDININPQNKQKKVKVLTE